MSKYVVNVNTAALHLMDASINPMGDAIVTAVLTKQGITATLLKSTLNNIGSKIPQFHAYAKNDYTLALPTGKTRAIDSIDNADLALIIATDIGYPDGVLVSDNSYTTISPALMAQPYLLANRSYEPRQNEIYIFPDDMVFDDVWVEAGDNIELVSSDDLPKRVTIESILLSTDGLNAEIAYDLWLKLDSTWLLNSATYIESISIPGVASIEWDLDYLFALYQKLDNQGSPLSEVYAWIYNLADGTYPSLYGVDNELPADEFLPVVPIRYNNDDYTDISREADPLFITSKRLLKKINIDFEEMGVKLNANPSIADIDHAYVMFGVDLQSNNSASIQYLHKFFGYLYDLQLVDRIRFLDSLNDPSVNLTVGNSYRSAVGGVRNFEEYGLDLTIKHEYINSFLVDGTVDRGRPGDSRKSFEPYTVMVPAGPGNMYGEGDGSDYVIPLVAQTRYKLVLESQVAPNSIWRLEVHGLETKNSIYASRNHSIITTLADIAVDPENSNLIIPVQYRLAQELTMRQRNAFYADSALMVINSYQITKLKWYQRGWFKVILIIIVIIIIAYTGQAWLMNLALKTGIDLAIYLAVSALVVAAMDMAFDWIVDEYGEKLGIIGAIILAIAAIVLTQGRGTKAAMEFMMTTAQTMLQASTVLISSVNEFLIEEAVEITNEYADFTDKLEERNAELKTATDLLGMGRDINPLMFSGNRIRIVYETPRNMIQRTLRIADNTMYILHDEIPNFISNRLKLDRGISADLYNMNTYS